jgi:2-haloacid dehalogenase
MTDPASPLTGIRALTFDVFGTVVDWREGVAREVEAILPGLDGRNFADRWRAGYQPAMQAVREGGRAWLPLDELHREILVDVLGQVGLADVPVSVVDELNLAWHRLDPWPDVRESMARLRTNFVLASLSNGNISLMVDLTRRADLRFDCILGAEVARAYKPMPAVYLGAAKVLNLAPEQLLMVAAHPSDLDAAKACGLKTAYVHRAFEYGRDGDRDWPEAGRFDLAVESFAALADQMGC